MVAPTLHACGATHRHNMTLERMNKDIQDDDNNVGLQSGVVETCHEIWLHTNIIRYCCLARLAHA